MIQNVILIEDGRNESSPTKNEPKQQFDVIVSVLVTVGKTIEFEEEENIDSSSDRNVS